MSVSSPQNLPIMSVPSPEMKADPLKQLLGPGTDKMCEVSGGQKNIFQQYFFQDLARSWQADHFDLTDQHF